MASEGPGGAAQHGGQEAKKAQKRLQEMVLRTFWKQKLFEKRFFANLIQKIDFAKKHAKP